MMSISHCPVKGRWMRIIGVLLGLLALWGNFAPAAQANQRIGPFQIFQDMEDVILLDGELGIDAAQDFGRALLARPAAKVLVLGSPGGDIASALLVAKEVHNKGLSTAIPSGFACHSSCAYVFLAGRERLAEGDLGVHQMADPATVPGQPAVATVINVLKTFDAPTELVTRLFRTPADDMYVFSSAELDSLGVNRLGPVVLTTLNIARVAAPGSNAAIAMADPVTTPHQPAPPALQVPALPPPSMRVALYGGLDFYGHDISSQRTPDAVGCAVTCLMNNQCQAFTYNANPSLTRGPNCFLKSNVDRLEAYRDAFSGVFLPADGQPAATYAIGAIDPTQDLLLRQGLTGEDFATSPERGIASPGDCRMACVDDNACQAFTYDSRRKQCFLKHDLGDVFEANQLTSGIKRGLAFDPLDVIELRE